MSENVGEVKYRKVSVEEMGLVKGDLIPYSLFVFLHASNRYHPIVEQGQRLEGEHWSNLAKLDAANLYISSEDFKKWEKIREKKPENILKKIPVMPFNGQVLGDEAKVQLKLFYETLTRNPLTGTAKAVAISELSEFSEGLLKSLVPEAADMKSSLINQMRNIHVMHDAAAISSLALLAALSNDFESRSSLGNIGKACILMDAGLGDLEEEHLETYYRNRNELPVHIRDKIHGHPLKSTYLGQEIELAEALSQMILVHHELYNGKGYHRGIRTSGVSPLSRCLCMAVDIFEQLKGAELRGHPVSLASVIRGLMYEQAEPTERRHGKELVKKLCDYLGIK